MPSMPMMLFSVRYCIEAHVGAVIGIDRRQLLDDEPGDVRPAALDVLAVDAVVPDQRVGHRHDLPLVGRIGEDLLVPGHRGVEDDLALGSSGVPNERPVKTVPSSKASLAGRSLVRLVGAWGADYRESAIRDTKRTGHDLLNSF